MSCFLMFINAARSSKIMMTIVYSRSELITISLDHSHLKINNPSSLAVHVCKESTDMEINTLMWFPCIKKTMTSKTEIKGKGKVQGSDTCRITKSTCYM